MNRINVLFTDANGNLANEKAMIKDAVAEAQEYTFLKLHINWDIDLLVTNHLHDILIPEDGVGGRAITSDFIEFAIDETKATENLISEMIVHELCHTARWGKNDEWINSLFDDVIFEGIATYLEAEYAKDREEKSFFIQTILKRNDEENEKILEQLRQELESTHYDYDTIFFKGDDKLPRWAGYSLGYYLIRKYLERTGKKVEEIFADKYADFRLVM